MTSDDFRDTGHGADASCPRCHALRLRAWHELSAEEQILVERLPASADYTREERRTRHRWCTRCWHESTGRAPHHA